MSPLSPHSARLTSSLLSLQQRWGVGAAANATDAVAAGTVTGPAAGTHSAELDDEDEDDYDAYAQYAAAFAAPDDPLPLPRLFTMGDTNAVQNNNSNASQLEALPAATVHGAGASMSSAYF